MNYAEWCELVLVKLDHESDVNSYLRGYGIDVDRMEKLIWGEHYDEIRNTINEKGYQYILDDALFDLEQLGLVEDGSAQHHKLTLYGRAAAKNLRALWEKICLRQLPSTQRKVLEVVNGLSSKDNEEFARVEIVDEHRILNALVDLDESFNSLTNKDLAELFNDLRSRGLVFAERGQYPDGARANYTGLIWEKKRELIVESKEIDSLVESWETTSVEFKRELYLDSASEKAEFIKDVIGLANTQASGRRWLIVGFDDQTQQYYSPASMPDREMWIVKISRDRLEQILSVYVSPSISIRYELVNYRGGQVGKIEIIRDPKKLPYRVNKSLGEKAEGKRIEDGDIFVRHGSHTVKPDDKELQDLMDESSRAKTIS